LIADDFEEELVEWLSGSAREGQIAGGPLAIKPAELLLAKGAGEWDFGELRAKVIGKAPILVIVEFAGGVCGGFAAVPFQDKMDEWIADPTGASFVFSLRPTVARYPLKGKTKAVFLDSRCGGGFKFGAPCLGIWNDGDMSRREETYAVPSGWGGCVEFTRFEVCRVAS
jgi:hypothetical protein